MKKHSKIYLAGRLTPQCLTSVNPAIDYLFNLRTMFKWAVKVLLAGFDPFCPAADFMYFLNLAEDEHITEQMIKRYSKSWLEACDAMLLLPGWKDSAGTLAEIKFCEEHNIPVFETLDELILFTKGD